jgi:GT2 family glycosyltransferase
VVDVADAPAITVVVATHNRAERLAGVLAALADQRITAPFDVVVVDDASTDGTWATLTRLAVVSPIPVRPIRRTVNGGPGHARNTGWRASTAPLVAFTDDDCTPQPEWLAAHLAALADADVSQGVTVPDPSGRFGPFSRSLTVLEEGLYPTCNVAYRRATLDAVGGFDETYHLSCEDTDLAYRAKAMGARTAFTPGAVVHHEVHRSSYRDYVRDKLRWGGVPLVVRRHPTLRAKLHHHWFWKQSHPAALGAAAGIAVAATAMQRRPTTVLRLLAGAALAAPYVRFRIVADPLPAGPRRRLALIPLALAADLVEVGVMVHASTRARTLVL